MKLKVNKIKEIAIYLFMIAPFFKPVGAAIYPNINNFFRIWKLLTLIVICLYMLLCNKKICLKPEYKGLIGFCGFSIIYIANSIRYGNPAASIINNIMTNLILMLFIIKVSRESYLKIDSFLLSIDILFSFWIVLQILSVFYVRAGHIIFEKLEGDFTYLFGTDNYSAFAMIPMIIIVYYIAVVRASNKLTFLKNKTLLFALTLSYIYTKSASAAIICLMLSVFLIFNKKLKNVLKCLTLKRWIVLLLVLLILILRYNIHYYLVRFITEIFGKGDKAGTLNSRTIIWSMAINLIRKKLFFGYGTFSKEAIDSYILYGIDHTHNIFLELLLRTGIVGSCLYLIFLIKPIVRLEKQLYRSKSNILIVGLICFLLLSFMDTYPLMQYQYLLVGLIYSWRDIENKYTKREGKIISEKSWNSCCEL